jgi:hypothetical protein
MAESKDAPSDGVIVAAVAGPPPTGVEEGEEILDNFFLSVMTLKTDIEKTRSNKLPGIMLSSFCGPTKMVLCFLSRFNCMLSKQIFINICLYFMRVCVCVCV